MVGLLIIDYILFGDNARINEFLDAIEPLLVFGKTFLLFLESFIAVGLFFTGWVVKMCRHPLTFDFAVGTLAKLKCELLPEVSFGNGSIDDVVQGTRVALDDSIDSRDN